MTIAAIDPEMQWVIGSLLAVVGAGLAGYVTIVQRITRLETLIEMIGIKAAKILHSPHTPELDALLEKVISPEHKVSPPEWQRLLEMCEEIENNPDRAKEERSLAALVAVIARKSLGLVQLERLPAKK